MNFSFDYQFASRYESIIGAVQGDVMNTRVSLPNIVDRTSLADAFKTLLRIREEKRTAFPFLKQSVDYALVLYIGNEQSQGRPPNMNNILTSGLGTPSTLIRRISELEELGIIKKTRGATDKRNTYYDLTALPLVSVESFLNRAASLFVHHRLDLTAR